MQWQATLPRSPAMVPVARHFVLALLEGTERRQDLALVIDELAANAVKHGDGDFTVTLAHASGRARFEVTTHGGGECRVTAHRPGRRDVPGRGLLIVEALAERWGHGHTGEGCTTVWAELTVRPQDR